MRRNARKRVIGMAWVLSVSAAWFFLPAVCIAAPSVNPVISRLEQSSTSLGIAHYIMGMNDEMNDAPDKALLEYARAVQYDGSAFLPHLRLGMSYLHASSARAAREEFTAAIKIRPDDMQAHYYLALAYSALQDVDKAASEFELILKNASASDPKNAELYLYLGQMYVSQDKMDQAVLQFEKLLQVQPQNTDIMYVVASRYLEVNRRDDAKALFLKCIDADPVHSGCLNALAYTYAEDNTKMDDALRFVTLALKAEPDNGAYLDTLGWVYYRKGMYVDALKELNKANVLIDDPVLFDHLGEVYMKLGNPDMAKKYWHKSLELDGEQPVLKGKLQDVERPEVFNRTGTK
ncbi:MAG: tetratricopeptide repeat protein [Candidatus Omnitrophica bacterium]|nr:tetratricopeptide repeat protein [Candidatus Omnitrophota bacterium]